MGACCMHILRSRMHISRALHQSNKAKLDVSPQEPLEQVWQHLNNENTTIVDLVAAASRKAPLAFAQAM